MIEVLRTERHQINKNHPLWKYCDDLCFKSKNLYNAANYHIRQVFITASKLKEGKLITKEQQDYLDYINCKVDEYNLKKKNALLKKQSKGKSLDKEFKALPYFGINHKYLGYDFLEFLMSDCVDYRAMMAQAAQQTLRLLDKDWISFFGGIKKYMAERSGFTGRPKLPNYKNKNGRAIAIFTNQNCKLVDGYIRFPKCFDQFKLKTNVNNINQIRIKPQGGNYLIEVVYEIEVPESSSQSQNIIGIDLGINNFATVSNNIGLQPFIINGKIIKSVNQYYNKQLADLKSELKKRHGLDWSKKLQTITNKRNNRVNDFIHKASKYIIDWCVLNNIDTIVVGKNDGWKQEIGMRDSTNQNFVQIPHALFIEKLQYKAENNGITVICTEESYTSKASFIDGDVIPTYKGNSDNNFEFSGKRVKRGLYKSKKGILINADLNGSYNIIKKVLPKAFAEGIEGVYGLHPSRVNVA